VHHVHAGHNFEQLTAYVLNCAYAARGIVELAWVGFGVGDELGNRHCRERRVYLHYTRRQGDARDRRNVADVFESDGIQALIIGVVGGSQEKRIAVRLEGQFDGLPALMADLVRRRVAVIATPGNTPGSPPGAYAAEQDVCTAKVEGRYPAVLVFSAYSRELQTSGAPIGTNETGSRPYSRRRGHGRRRSRRSPDAGQRPSKHEFDALPRSGSIYRRLSSGFSCRN
jgi:hypothetical protein